MVAQAKPAVVEPRRVINLMEALRRSIAEDKKPPAVHKSAAPARKRA
jgi:non-homologous end joining protein Ku